MVPIAVIGAGAGVATALDGGAQLLIGVAVTLVSLTLLWPWFYVREVSIDADFVTVSAGLPGRRTTERHPRSALTRVRWRMKRPKAEVPGGSNAKVFHLELVGEGDLIVALPIERYDVSVAREIGRKLGLPVERMVGGEVAERWDADGKPVV